MHVHLWILGGRITIRRKRGEKREEEKGGRSDKGGRKRKGDKGGGKREGERGREIREESKKVRGRKKEG